MDDTTTLLTELDELAITVVVDNESDTLSSVAPGVPQAPEMASLVGRIPATADLDGEDCVPVFGHLCVACHGFSAVLRTTVGGESHTVLFDAGPSGDVWLDNADRLAIDLSAIEAVFLSHWHWDHSGALPVVIAAIADARSSGGLPPPTIDLHPDRPDQRGVQTPAGTVVLLPDEPTWESLADAGGDVERHRDPHLLAGHGLLGSGAIDRTTSYETGLHGHQSWRDGQAEPDPLIMDERLLCARVRGRGVTVLSACSHAGIVNVCLHAQQLTGGADLDLVLGGYHLAGAAMEARIAETVRDLGEMVRPRLLGPGHCTGWRAKAALAERFSPERYAPSVVGTRYLLAAR